MGASVLIHQDAGGCWGAQRAGWTKDTGGLQPPAKVTLACLHRENRGNRGALTPKPRKPGIWGFFGGVLVSGRHPRGFPDPMGAILRNYRHKPSHMDLVRSNFHDFPPDLAVSNLHSLYIRYVESMYLLYANPITSSAEKLQLLLQGRVSL